MPDPLSVNDSDSSEGKMAALSLVDDAVLVGANFLPKAAVGAGLAGGATMTGGAGLWSRLMSLGEASATGIPGAAIGAGLMAPLALDVGRKLVGSLGTDRLDQMVKGQRSMMLDSLRERMENERLQGLMAVNTQRLAQFAPDLYTQVMAGRRLPRGAVVIGGTPRLDVMDQLALAMSQGKMSQQPPSAADELSRLM